MLLFFVSSLCDFKWCDLSENIKNPLRQHYVVKISPRIVCNKQPQCIWMVEIEVQCAWCWHLSLHLELIQSQLKFHLLFAPEFGWPSPGCGHRDVPHK